MPAGWGRLRAESMGGMEGQKFPGMRFPGKNHPVSKSQIHYICRNLFQMIQVEKQLFTVEDYYKMADAGIIRPEDRVELIKGEIIKMSPIRSRHAAAVDILTELLISQLRKQYAVRVQNPIRLENQTEPEPDLLIAKFRKDRYRSRHPRPDDVYLIIEVADSSLEYDREVKAALYAEAGIPEYWIVNLEDEQLEIYRQPEAGKYRHENFCRGEEVVACSTIEFEVSLAELFG